MGHGGRKREGGNEGEMGIQCSFRISFFLFSSLPVPMHIGISNFEVSIFPGSLIPRLIVKNR